MHQSGFKRLPALFLLQRLTLGLGIFLLPALLATFSAAEKTPFSLKQLHLPDGFHIAVFADNIDSARMLTFTPGGVLLVSESGEGKVVALPDPKHTGKAAREVDVLSGLNEPHGIAFYQGKLYVAENDKVRRYDWDEATLHATNPTKLADLPTGGGHSTRSILFHGGKMYISAGSSCNVCIEKDPRRATVMEFNPDGSGQKIFAKGLRNAVGLAENPKTDTVWVTVNGRDWLGDDLPPETIYDLGKDGGDAGWPYCYGDRVPDPNFTKAAGVDGRGARGRGRRPGRRRLVYRGAVRPDRPRRLGHVPGDRGRGRHCGGPGERPCRGRGRHRSRRLAGGRGPAHRRHALSEH
jgi:glucose/arabinose dehydrogenase